MGPFGTGNWGLGLGLDKNKFILFDYLKFADQQVLQTESSHPVHILNSNGELSRSSFIPFCSFGDKLIGSEVDGFDMKVCNIFKPKLFYDQLCYETDLQELKDRDNLKNQLELGLTLVFDYNEERQKYSHSKNVPFSKREFSYNLDNGNSSSLYLDTISNIALPSTSSPIQSPYPKSWINLLNTSFI